MPPSILLVTVALAVTMLASVAIARALVIARPDEWLLCIRNGRPVKAGVGISLWRWPGDVVARFTSTLQRVSFSVGALSRERLRVSIDGFILWSVAAEADGPFRAFQKLGLVNLDAPPRDLRSPKHLLSTPQHRAFQQLLAAAVQRLAATRSLDELLLEQAGVVTELRAQLEALEQQMGIRVDRIELLQVRPAEEELLRQMSAAIEERVREEAASVRLEANERAARRAIESEARLALERAAARARERDRAQAEALENESRATQIAQAVLQRDELQLAARLDRTRREADAERDAMSALASAEEKKSQAVRDYELGRLAVQKVGDALKALPLQEARWVTVGPDSPVSGLASLITAARELAIGGSKGGSPDYGGRSE